MSNTSELDHAIEMSVAKLAKNLKYAGPIPAIDDMTRSFCRDMIAELLRDMEPETLGLISPPAWKGFEVALTEIRRRVGIMETV